MSIRTITHISNDAPAHKYTARASYQFADIHQGQCIDIDRMDTVGMRVGIRPLGRRLQWLVVCLTYVFVACSTAVVFRPASTTFRRVVCVVIGLFSLVVPVVMLLDANVQLLKRIFRTFLPFIKLYFVSIEVVCLCDMCGWSYRAVAVAPLLWSSQLVLFLSDATFFRTTQRGCVHALLALFIAWRIVMIVGVRFELFGDVRYHVFDIAGVSFMNSGTLISKLVGMTLFMIGQVVFKVRHPANLYSIRTTYTLLENKVWNQLERDKRVERKTSRAAEVEKVKSIIVDIS